MKITINAFGTRGDVQPYVALGIGLTQAGHQVRILTHQIFEAFVRKHNLDFMGLSADPRQVLLSQSVSNLGTNSFRIMQWLKENFEPVLTEIFQTTFTAADQADLVVNSTLSFAGYHVAEKLSIPAVAAYLQPVTPSRHLPGSFGKPLPRYFPLRGWINYATTKISNQLFFYLLLPLTNKVRKEVLGLDPLSQAHYWGLDSPKSQVPLLYGFSPSVVPKPPDWQNYQQITGYWFLEDESSYDPPPDLSSFLNAKPNPIYIGFGSMVDHEREAITRLVVDALQQSGQRAVLLGGWSRLGGLSLPDTIYQIEEVPHSWLFPRMAAVVHHGGAGTTAAGLRAGVPTVVIPFFGDQRFWGWRIKELGAGPHPLERKKLTAHKLSNAIQEAVSSPKIVKNADEIGKQIRNEDGVGTAVRLIERYAATGKF